MPDVPIHLEFADGALELDLTTSKVFDFDHPLTRFVLPVVAIDELEMRPLGTSFFIAPGLALTARHVVEDFLPYSPGGATELQLLLFTDQVDATTGASMDGPMRVVHCEAASADADGRVAHDLALLIFEHRGTDEDTARLSRVPLTFTAPAVGDEILALGYTSSPDGMPITIDGDLASVSYRSQVMACRGLVEEVHPDGRDRVLLTFPVALAGKPNHPGMSGGPVLNTSGLICGMTTSGGDGDLPWSYVSFLRPLLGIEGEVIEGKTSRGWSFRTFFAEGRVLSDGTAL